MSAASPPDVVRHYRDLSPGCDHRWLDWQLVPHPDGSAWARRCTLCQVDQWAMARAEDPVPPAPGPTPPAGVDGGVYPSLTDGSPSTG